MKRDGPMVNGRNQNDYAAAERPCYAHGCPELGTITTTVQASRTAIWFCRHHYVERDNPRRWAAITHGLRAQA